MKKNKEYSVPFSGLKLGLHHFEFDVKDAFFKEHDNLEVQGGNIRVDLELDRQSTMLVLNFHIYGTVSVTCDRCMDDFEFEIDTNNKLIAKLGGEEMTNTDDIIIVPAYENNIDLSHYIYEYITLALPISKIHPDNEDGEPTCNKETLSKLEEISVKEDNSEVEIADPRWEVLKKIKN